MKKYIRNIKNNKNMEIIFPKHKKVFLITVYYNLECKESFSKKIDCWYN